MSTAFDPKDKNQKKMPVREGQGKESSIRADNDPGDSEAYPKPNTSDKQQKEQDEYDYIRTEKENKSV